MTGSTPQKVALVTGASRGIGRAVARRFASDGLRVFGVARNEAALNAVADEINRDGVERFFFEPGDLCDPDFCTSLPDKCVERWGRLDVLVNNAGTNPIAAIEQLPLESWDETLQVNLTAPFLLTKASLPHLRNSRSGVIINISSVSAKVGLPKFAGFAAYCASKYGLQGLTDVTYTEAKDSGVRVVAVQPGATDTDLLRSTLPEEAPALAPEDVAEVIAFLISEAARKINGATIEVFP